MGLFDQVANALSNPNQAASSSQLNSILGTVSQLSGRQGVDASTTQTLMTVVGQHLRGALKTRSSADKSESEALVNRYSGTEANPEAVQAILSPQEQAETVEDAAQKTGIDSQTIQTLLPIVVPLILQFLQSGANKQSGQSGNSVLETFLDSDRDGDIDVGDAMSVAGRFLQNR